MVKENSIFSPPWSQFSKESIGEISSSDGECSSRLDKDRSSESKHLDHKAVDRLIGLVCRTLGIREEETQSPSSKHFSSLKKRWVTFPVNRVIKDLISAKWAKSEKKCSPEGKMSRLYLFLEEDVSA